jgi:hypothetical protein
MINQILSAIKEILNTKIKLNVNADKNLHIPVALVAIKKKDVIHMKWKQWD